MARDPRKEGKSKKRGKKGASGRSGASRSAPKSLRKSPAKIAKTVRHKRRAAGPKVAPASLEAALREAQIRQAATAEILKIVADSPTDVKQVFEAIVRTIVRVMQCDHASIMRCDDKSYHLVARAALDGSMVKLDHSERINPEANFPSRAIVSKKTVYYPDRSLTDLPEYERAINERFGVNSSLFLPLLRQEQCIGVVVLASKRVNLFSPSDIALAESFRDQALIAIENARLFHETNEALARQTATSEVLQVISSSPGDLKPVFDQMLAKAMRLCEAQCGFIYQGGQGAMRAVAEIGVPRAFAEYRRQHLHTGGAATPIDAMRATRKPAHVHDARDSEPYRSGNPNAVAGVDLGGARTVLYVPMIRNDDIVGVINLYRQEVKPFTDEQIALLENFASQAVIAIENARLFNETKEALAQQTATSEVLQVISSSMGDVQPVFEQMLEKATRVCGAEFGVMGLYEGEVYRRVALYNVPPAFAAVAPKEFRPSPDGPIGTPQRTGQVFKLDDLSKSEAYLFRHNAAVVAMVEVAGVRTIAIVPMMKDGEAIGAISIYRQEVRPFNDRQIELLKNFANQAVIAIENARLFNETKEALAQQTATSEVLRVISNSVADTAPVFEKILDSCEKLFATEQLGIFVVQPDGQTHVGAWRGGAVEAVIQSLPRPLEETATGLVIRNRTVMHIANTATAQNVPPTVQFTRDQYGDISIAWAPMLTEQAGIGSIAVMRQPPNPFSDKELELLKTFADQAVIALQNTRLFNETREALERQTATADILRVIASSPHDVQPVFQAIADRSNRLVDALSTTVFGLVDGMSYLRAFTPTTPEADAKLQAMFPAPLSALSWGEAIGKGEIYRVIDAEQEPEPLRDVARKRGWRSALIVPLLRDGKPIGMIGPTRAEPGPFSDHHVQLMQTFADQAVIAIQNVELFEEVQAKTRDLEESLQFQTATSEVLKVISRSPDKLQPVLDAIVKTSRELCSSDASTIFLIRDRKLHFAAIAGVVPKHFEHLLANPIDVDEPGSLFERLIRQKRTLHFDNVLDDPELNQNRIRLGGPRALLAAPLLNQGEVVGAFVLRQSHLKPFTERQIQAIEVFADQAVIAISNVGLFEEVQAKTRDLEESLQQQTATADVLKVISRSAFDLQTVLDTLVESAYKLCSASLGLLYLRGDEDFECKAIAGVGVEAASALFKGRPIRAGRGTAAERVILTGEVHAVTDFFADPEFDPMVRDRIRNDSSGSNISQLRSTLAVPMMRENVVVGVMVIARPQTGTFPQRQTELLQTFADQAVIAIENARLFEQVQDRTRELSQSLDDLRAAQDRLVQTEKLASLGQLTAGIAHEIKNPLNFVNNFSALSVELTDELNDLLKQAELAEKLRHEVGELTQLLKSNLEKVVQHGKRADSIVKNMLLHSREGSGEQRAADINGLVEESLNLAYHGARAEKSAFNITLEREFDASAGAAELFPQEITRALLNLISNGFYAATRRKTENGDGAFEPTLLATTKNLGSSVEIRIRDNGTGISPEVKEKMFNPFFTTKPAGEGTGLGLSMTHDIIVKQHGGTIDVATAPGQFTEFIVVLPRANKNRGQA